MPTSPMTLDQCVARVRSYTRDDTGAIFKKIDLETFVNEAIDRIRNIPELSNMQTLIAGNQLITLLPTQYHYLVPVYASARAFEQDERHYQATQKMNEFEVKLAELETKIKNGEINILDADGNVVESPLEMDAVVDEYHKRYMSDEEVVM